MLLAMKNTGKELGALSTMLLHGLQKMNGGFPEHFSKDWKIDFEYNKEHKDDQFKTLMGQRRGMVLNGRD